MVSEYLKSKKAAGDTGVNKIVVWSIAVLVLVLVILGLTYFNSDITAWIKNQPSFTSPGDEHRVADPSSLASQGFVQVGKIIQGPRFRDKPYVYLPSGKKTDLYWPNVAANGKLYLDRSWWSGDLEVGSVRNSALTINSEYLSNDGYKKFTEDNKEYSLPTYEEIIQLNGSEVDLSNNLYKKTPEEKLQVDATTG